MSRSQKWRQEWSFFIGDSGRRKYNRFCVRCVHSCKQSFRADLIACPHFSRKASQCKQLGGEKGVAPGHFEMLYDRPSMLVEAVVLCIVGFLVIYGIELLARIMSARKEK